MKPKSGKETEYAIRCFKNGKRKYTARLTACEAMNFKTAAKHLAEFISETYKLPVDPNPEGSCQDCNRFRLMLIRNLVCPDCGQKAQAGWNINRYGVWCEKCQRWHDPGR